MRALAILLALLTSSSTLATNDVREITQLDSGDDGTWDVSVSYGVRGNVKGLSKETGAGIGYYAFDYDHAMRRIVKDVSFLVSSEYRTELTYGLGRDVLFERGIRDWAPVSEYWDEYIWLGGERIASRHRIPDGTMKTFFFVNDRMGTARRAYDAETGELRWRVITDPWGRGRRFYEAGFGPTTTPSTWHRGPGQYEDEGFGLVENGYRVLVPELGQYTSADPMHRAQVYSHFGPQAYAYAGGDPNQYVDPSGLLPMDSTGWDDVATSIQGMSGDERADLALVGAGALALGLGVELMPLVPAAYAAGTSALDAASLWLYARLSALAAALTQGQTCGGTDHAATSRILRFSKEGLQHFFSKHGPNFGLNGNWNPSRAAEASRVLNQHVNNPAVLVIEGAYRGSPATIYLDPSTGLGVVADTAGKFMAGWRLGSNQVAEVLNKGHLW